MNGKDAYEDFSEEMPISAEDLNNPDLWCQRSREAAEEYAREAHLPWPPNPVDGWTVNIFN